VIRARLKDGVPTGEYEDFMTGFVVNEKRKTPPKGEVKPLGSTSSEGLRTRLKPSIPDLGNGSGL
jgi:hypothetical protein